MRQLAQGWWPASPIHHVSADGITMPLSLAINVILRACASSWWGFSLRGTSLSFVHLVLEHCPFIDATRQGDVMTMRYLLETRQANPNDVTPKNVTAIFYAIENGRTDSVELLLEYGARAEGSFGYMQTSPLGWALGWRQFHIARRLLAYGASSTHTMCWGWTPLFYLWQEHQKTMPSAQDFVVMLASRPDFDMSHSGVTDGRTFGVIHRAVRFGTVEDVSTLLKMGVDPHATVGIHGWTAIQIAVHHGKLEKFETLLPYYNDMSIDTPDARGWTLLHISASAGQSEMTRRLLRLGADPKAMRKPCWTSKSMPQQCMACRSPQPKRQELRVKRGG